MSKHAAPRYTRAKRVVTGGTLAVGATVVGLGAIATPAQAADWSGVAQCESGGNWRINTGNGYYGGLQFARPPGPPTAAGRTPPRRPGLAGRRSPWPSRCSPPRASAPGRSAASTWAAGPPASRRPPRRPPWPPRSSRR